MNIRDYFWAYIDVWVESNKGSDPSTHDQCIDAWRIYNRKVIQAPDIFGNPTDIWNKYQADYYEKIPNTPEGVPQLGDVMIWGTRYGKYGHIAVCTEIANTRTFTSFDQNDPVGESCHFQPHTYTGLLGWLRPKNQSNIKPLEEDNADKDKIKILEIKVKSLTDDLAKAVLENDGLRKALADQERDNRDLTEQVEEIKGERNTAIGLQKDLEGRITKLEGEAVKLEEGIKTRDETVAGLRNDLTVSVATRIKGMTLWKLLKVYFSRGGGKK